MDRSARLSWARIETEYANDVLIQVRRSSIRGMGATRGLDEDTFLLEAMRGAARRYPHLKTLFVTLPEGYVVELDLTPRF